MESVSTLYLNVPILKEHHYRFKVKLGVCLSLSSYIRCDLQSIVFSKMIVSTSQLSQRSYFQKPSVQTIKNLEVKSAANIRSIRVRSTVGEIQHRNGVVSRISDRRHFKLSKMDIYVNRTHKFKLQSNLLSGKSFVKTESE